MIKRTAASVALVLSIALLSWSSEALAEKFRLKTGEIIEGTIRNEDPDYFTIQLADESDLIVFKSDIVERGASVRGAPTIVAAPKEREKEKEPAPAAGAAASLGPGQASSWFQGVSGFERAMAQQKESGQPVAVYFYATWCPYCRALERDVLSKAKVEKHLERALKVKVDIDEDPDLARQFGIASVPGFVVISAKRGTARKLDLYTQPEPFIDECRRAGIGP